MSQKDKDDDWKLTFHVALHALIISGKHHVKDVSKGAFHLAKEVHGGHVPSDYSGPTEPLR